MLAFVETDCEFAPTCKCYEPLRFGTECARPRAQQGGAREARWNIPKPSCVGRLLRPGTVALQPSTFTANRCGSARSAPVPGRSRWRGRSALESSEAIVRGAVAAPGDGRTPAHFGLVNILVLHFPISR